MSPVVTVVGVAVRPVKDELFGDHWKEFARAVPVPPFRICPLPLPVLLSEI
jgi:hypothetical protein